VIFDLAGKDQLKNFARGLLVTRFKQAARRMRRISEPGAFCGSVRYAGEFGVKSSELRRDLQIERDQRCRLRLASFLRQRGDRSCRSRILLRANQVLDPAHLPGTQVLFGILAFEAVQFGHGCISFDSRMRW
jgi:hypothetical protein